MNILQAAQKKHKSYMRKVEEIWESTIDMRIYDKKIKRNC